jgi:hypothetical protein
MKEHVTDDGDRVTAAARSRRAELVSLTTA